MPIPPFSNAPTQVATNSRLGKVKPDGTTITVSSGTISATQWPVILLQDQKASGTEGGAVGTANSWVTRTLNTKVRDDTGSVTLSSNTFTLPAGTYVVLGSSPYIQISRVQTRLYNVTDSAAAIIGTVEYSAPAAAQASCRSVINGTVTIASTKTFRIDYWVTATNANTYAQGGAVTTGSVEVYTTIQLFKTS